MLYLTIVTLVPIAEVEVPENGVMQEALQHDVLIARSSGIVYSAKAVGAARCEGGVGADIPCLLFDAFSSRVRE